jgi:type VI secretion system protein ImpF
VPRYSQTEPAPSLLDRLIDLEPESRQEKPAGPSELTQEFRAALCRDLSALLNTKRAADLFDRRFEEAANSLLTFGIADFTGYNLQKAPDQSRLCRSIERAIRQFEPRLERVEVSIEETGSRRPVVRLEIAALLRTEAGRPIVFQTTVHRDSRRIGVSGGA